MIEPVVFDAPAVISIGLGSPVALSSDMSDRPAFPTRRPLRLASYDYAAPATYFVTFCTAYRDPILSTIVGGRVQLLPAGREVARAWRAALGHTPGAACDAGVIMPDHVHAIVSLGEAVPASDRRSLSTLVGLIKSYSAVGINRARRTPGAPVWQRGFYDHVIRDVADLAAHRRYIARNPHDWTLKHTL